MAHIIAASPLPLGFAASGEEREDPCTGYPVGNFGIAGEVTPGGRGFSRVLYNPPVLGAWLEQLGRGRFAFTINGVTLADDEFAFAQVERLFPEARAVYEDPRLPGLRIVSRFIAPVRAGDAFACSVPALCAEIEIANTSDAPVEAQVAFEFLCERHSDVVSLANAGEFWLLGSDRMSIGFDGSVRWREVRGGMSVSAARAVPGGGSAKVRFALLYHHPDGLYTEKCADVQSLACWVSDNWDRLDDWRQELIEMLPRTHDDRVNRYLRWYLQAAVLLTRVTREHVLTMGYCELNQRDSYWTSWPHLVLWPDLERRMIRESAFFQSESGKIPSTVLPVIERGDDIDINEYFNLRIARYYEWTHDIEFVRELWPAFTRSIRYLESTDRDGDGLLDQGSFWADWKDVKGVEGRKAAPHFEFLWLAVLKHAQLLAENLNDIRAVQNYAALYERAARAVHADIDHGGLWNGRFYATLWNDGRRDDHVQEDQCVGPLFGVVPADRVESIYRAPEASMTEWGGRDTWPYRENFSNVGGDYHNGGVWVFLNFADAMSRFICGYPDTAWQILRRVGHWDLEKWGDYMPAEYLDGNTGANAGKPIQGWDSCFFAAVLFGALGVRMAAADTLEIMPRIESSQCFDTPIPTPYGILRVTQSAGPEGTRVELASSLDRAVTIRYGALGARGQMGQTVVIGECAFQVVEFKLAPLASRTLTFSY